MIQLKYQMDLVNMNKYDFILIGCLIVLSITILLIISSKNIDKVDVYYDNKIIKTIDLNKDNEYDVEGLNGNIHIVVKNKELRVTDEVSPLHLCRKQVIKNSNDTIICLPNHIVIKGQSEYDVIVGG